MPRYLAKYQKDRDAFIIEYVCAKLK